MFRVKKPQFLLLLKQGIRGVLKFKIQFIIIVILSTIASLLITVSFSSTERLQKSYNEVFAKIDKPNFISTNNVGINVPKSEKDYNQIIFTDFINSQFIYNEDEKVSGLNLNLSSFKNYESEGYYETFVTKTFESEEFNLFFDKWINFRGKQIFGFSYDPLNDSINFNPSTPANKEIWNTFEYNKTIASYLGAGKESENLANKLNLKLKENLAADLKNKKNYLNNTTIYNLFYGSDSIFYNKYKTSENQSLENFIDDQIIHQKMNDKNYLLANYIDSFFSGLILQIDYNFSTMIDVIVRKSLENYNGNLWDFINDFNSKSSNFELFESENQTDFQIVFEKNKKFIYEFVFGKEYKSSSTIISNDKFLVNDNSKPYSLNVNKNNLVYATSINDSNDDGSLAANGFRGTLQQLIPTVNKNSLFKESMEMNVMMSRRQKFNFLEQFGYNFLYGLNYDLGTSFNPNNSSIQTEWATKNELLALSQGFEFQPRIEFTLIDKQSENSYRNVLLTSELLNQITITSGNSPQTSSEILISSGFAYKNKIKVGDSIVIGGSTLYVSGFATEPLTYYPVADQEVPFPNSHHDAIVYAGSDQINYISENGLENQITIKKISIYTNKSNVNTINRRMNLIEAGQFNNIEKLKEDLNFVNGTSSNFETINRVSKFEDTPWDLNYNLQPMITKIYKIFTISFSAVVMLIAAIAIAIAIKKTVQFNQKQIGILKALGVRSSSISLSYLSYAIIVTFIIVPLTFIIGSFLQEPLYQVFIPYFGGEKYEAVFSPNAFAISFIIFGAITLIMSFIIALFLTSKPVLLIMNPKKVDKRSRVIDFFKIKLFSKSRFSIRFSLDLASSGYKKTFMLFITVLLTSFVISLSISIPGVLENVMSNYHKSIKYNNELIYNTPVGNAPLSKKSITPWKGPDYYEKYLNSSDGFFGSAVDSYSNDMNNISGTRDTSVIPKFILNNSEDENKIDVDWTFLKMIESVTSNNNKEENGLISVLGSIFGNNFKMPIGKNFSISDVELFLNALINLNFVQYENDFNGLKRAEDIKSIGAVLDKGIPQILALVFSTINNDPGESAGETWKQQVSNMILSQVPQFIKKYVSKSENRQNQFTFGYHSTNYIPKEDNFYTKVKLLNNKSSMEVTGLSELQTAFNVENRKFSFSNEQFEEIQKLFDLNNVSKVGNIVKQVNNKEYEIYNSSTGVLNIPVLINKQAKSEFFENNLPEKNITTDSPRIITADGIDLPNEAWMYDDRDYKKIFSSSTTPDFIPISQIDLNKITSAPLYEKTYSTNGEWFEDYNTVSKIKNNSFGFGEIVNNTSLIRPYYSMDNMYLFIPQSISKEFLEVGGIEGNQTKGKWASNPISKNKIPISTVRAWENRGLLDNNYIAIRPYTFFINKDYIQEKENLSGALNHLLAPYNQWFPQVMNNVNVSKTPLKFSSSGFDVKKYLNKSNFINEINVMPVGEIETYGKSLIIADQKLLNLVSGYDNSFKTPFNYTYAGKTTGSYTNSFGKKIDIYEKVDPNTFFSNQALENNLIYDGIIGRDYRPNEWSSGVYSNEEEALMVTSQVEFTRTRKVGIELISPSESSSYGSTTPDYVKITFLSQQKDLMKQISDLVLSIGLIMIISIIIVATLTIVLICDLYVNQYKNFMVVMKSLGYKNKKIIGYTLGTVTVFATIALLAGTITANVVILLVMEIINNNGLALPIGISWWTPIASTILVLLAYIIAIAVSTRRVRKESPSILLSQFND